MDIDELESKFREWSEWRHRPERDVSENALRQGSRICQEFERLLDTEFAAIVEALRERDVLRAAALAANSALAELAMKGNLDVDHWSRVQSQLSEALRTTCR